MRLAMLRLDRSVGTEKRRSSQRNAMQRDTRPQCSRLDRISMPVTLQLSALHRAAAPPPRDFVKAQYTTIMFCQFRAISATRRGAPVLLRSMSGKVCSETFIAGCKTCRPLRQPHDLRVWAGEAGEGQLAPPVTALHVHDGARGQGASLGAEAAGESEVKEDAAAAPGLEPLDTRAHHDAKQHRRKHAPARIHRNRRAGHVVAGWGGGWDDGHGGACSVVVDALKMADAVVQLPASALQRDERGDLTKRAHGDGYSVNNEI